MFDYLVAVQFQVTTGGDGGEAGQNEVIEFPWVVLDVESKQIMDEQKLVVKPTAQARLSESCIAESGISQESVDEAAPLQTVVQEFNAYLYRSFTANNKDFCLVTFGEQPLKRWLRADAARKGVKLVAHYSKFVDVQAEFKRQKPSQPAPSTVSELASLYSVDYDSNGKGGIEQCRGICRVLGKMLAEGSKCNQTVNIPEDYDPLSSAGDEGSGPAAAPGGGGVAKPSDGAEGARAGDASDPNGPTIVKLRGLPFTASEGDVKDFFAGAQIALESGVVFVVNHDGRNNGEAFVKMETRDDYYAALKKDRERMQKRYVEVFGSTEADMESARKNNEAIRGGGRTLGTNNFFGVVKMRGLPYSATIRDIKDFFRGLEVKHNGVFLCEKDGRPNGEAFVEFTFEEAADEAAKKHKSTLGSRYVEIFKSSRVDMVQAMQIRDRRAAAFDSGEFFIKMRGIPYTAREREVFEFFTARSVTPAGVSLVYDQPDQITGTAFIEFTTPDELSRALSLNKETMGHRYVEIFRTTRNEAMQMLGVAQNQVPQPMMDPFGMGRGMPAGGFGFGGPMQDPWGMQGGGWAGGYGQQGGGGFPQQGAGGFAQQGGGGAFHQQMQGGFGGAGNPGGMGGDIGGMVAGSTLKIRGLPFRATPQDIADFFRGYSFIPESVQVVHADDGRSKGEGFIAFTSEAEASRAFADRNRGHMGNRYIELFPHN